MFLYVCLFACLEHTYILYIHELITRSTVKHSSNQRRGTTLVLDDFASYPRVQKVKGRGHSQYRWLLSKVNFSAFWKAWVCIWTAFPSSILVASCSHLPSKCHYDSRLAICTILTRVDRKYKNVNYSKIIASSEHTNTFCGHPVTTTARGVARNFLRGDKRGGLGDGSPQRGPGAEPRWGSGGGAPKSQRQMLISSYDGGHGHAPMPPLATPLTTASWLLLWMSRDCMTAV